MRARLCILSLALAPFVVGCASIAGTWQGGGPYGPDNPITAVTFCHDGTFTASADYGSGKMHAMSGCYSFKNEKLQLCTKDTTREYHARIDDCCLHMTHEGKTQTLCRLRCKDGKCCPDSDKCCKKL